MSSENPSCDSSASISLIDGLRGGSSEAWERMVDLYGPLVRTWCLYSGVPKDKIPDILQEVFLSVYRAADRFEPRESTAGFRGWVWMITKNKIRDHFRALSSNPNGVGGSTALDYIHHVADPELPMDEPSQPSDTAGLLHRALAMVKVEFRPHTWDAFWRATVLGQPNDLIAEELNLSLASVRQAKSRVLRRLRQQLGDMP